MVGIPRREPEFDEFAPRPIDHTRPMKAALCPRCIRIRRDVFPGAIPFALGPRAVGMWMAAQRALITHGLQTLVDEPVPGFVLEFIPAHPAHNFLAVPETRLEISAALNALHIPLLARTIFIAPVEVIILDRALADEQQLR